MRFSRAELEQFRDQEVPDLIGPGLKLLFVGINPGLWTAATQTHFSHPGNRFYPALLKAGIIAESVDAAAGMTQADRERFITAGIGFTNIVRRATVRADELSTAELRAGGDELRDRVFDAAPTVVAIAGITAYRSAFKLPKAQTGRQDDWPTRTGAAQVWVVPNPSGLNAHDTVDSLAAKYAEAARAAGVIDSLRQ